MGTRADFYIGRGVDAEWIGSIAFDGYPDEIAQDVLEAPTAEQYAAAVREFFRDRDDVSGPDHGWPWPWSDSRTTDYAYAFDGGAVWVSNFGDEWALAEHYAEDDHEERPRTAVFPDMSRFKNVTFGPRSGLLVLGIETREDQA